MKLIGTLRGHRNALLAVAFSPDGSRLAASTSDGDVLLWDMATTPPQEVGRLKGHDDGVFDVFFSADGDTLVSISLKEISAWRATPVSEAFQSITPIRHP